MSSTNPTAAPLEFVVCEAGDALARRVQRCVPHARVVSCNGDVGVLLREVSAKRDTSREAGHVLVIDMQGVPAMQWPLAADAAADHPTIWIAPPAGSPPGDAAHVSHVLPHDFTALEFFQLSTRLLEEAGARIAPAPDHDAGAIIASSPAMLALLAEVDLFANCDNNVLIEGETGTGKEQIALRLHNGHTRYGRGPFVPVNCGAIPDGLFESNFFGHARGAFTGALQTHKGYFEQAHGGTLFLDEVGDLPLHQQVKLLRVLETGRVTRLGTESPVAVDFRLVAATNRQLRDLVQRNEFRADLYFRLAVIEFQLPTLDERGIADKIAIFKSVVKSVVGDALYADLGEPPFWLIDSVADIHFTGNVRQLRNLGERVGVIARQTRTWDRALMERAVGNVRGQQTGIPAGVNARKNWNLNERSRLIDILDASNWKRQEAAQVLGISRKALWERMRKYQISEGDSKDKIAT